MPRCGGQLHESSLSPVPKGEGPGAPSVQLGTIIGTGATRRGVTCPYPADAVGSVPFGMFSGAGQLR